MAQLDRNKLDQMGVFVDQTGARAVVHHRPDTPALALRELRYCLGDQVEFIPLEAEVQKAFEQQNRDTGDIITELENYVSDADFERAAEIALGASSDTDAPVVKLFNNLLAVAISRSASDLHIDSSDRDLEIRMRFDGILVEYARLDLRIAPMLVSRIKLVSGMDITEKRKPQDGRFSVRHGGRGVDIRVASMPVKSGERLALRLFNRDANQVNLTDTGLADQHQQALTHAMSRQSGLILICGPTGSGKTTTIYSMLNTLCGRGMNIMTIEDPVEVELNGIVQTQVNDAIGFGFAEGLRSILRNDPDVVLVGEIRDESTAEIAVRAAMTGHLVISTVHANSPIGAIKRLINLGIDRSLLADCLLGVFTQRLVRTYCPDCGDHSARSPEHTTVLPAAFDGCDSCFHTGFSARVPVMSHVLLDHTARQAVERDLSALEYDDSMITEAQILHDQGKTPLFEVNKLKSA